jgi:hypothetical protein
MTQSGLVNGESLANYLNDPPGHTPRHDRDKILQAVILLRQRKARELGQLLAELPPVKWGAIGQIIELEHLTPLGRAFEHLSAVSLAGMLTSLRKCKRKACPNGFADYKGNERAWFMANRVDRQFCCSDCQQTFWDEFRSKTEEGREQQRLKMEKWRKKKRREKKRKTKGRK